MYHAVILCGGSATRLWPLTRAAKPKQFLAIGTERALLIETIERVKRLAPPERIWLVGGRLHESLMREQAPELPRENILAEPMPRDSTGAIGLAMTRILRRDPDAVFTAFHSDHVIRNVDAFVAAARLAAELAADGPIVNVGATPTYPETGYGYVERGREVARGDRVVAYDVVRFVEKPERARAEEYVAAGTYLWNVGMFTWRAVVIRELMDRHMPAGSLDLFGATERRLESDPSAAADSFGRLPRIAIDYAVLEKATERRVVHADMGWLDIGDWAAVSDTAAGSLPASAITVDSRGVYVNAPAGKVVATIGVEDLVIVDTGDALLVARRDRAQDVRKVVEQLKARGSEAVL